MNFYVHHPVKTVIVLILLVGLGAWRLQSRSHRTLPALGRALSVHRTPALVPRVPAPVQTVPVQTDTTSSRKYPLTVVTSYYFLNKTKHYDIKRGANRYLEWMANMLRIQHPMVVFCESSSIPLILAHRSSEMTRFNVTSINQFYVSRWDAQFRKQHSMDPRKS
eukprot:RCo050075